jgi:hypothetical protein
MILYSRIGLNRRPKDAKPKKAKVKSRARRRRECPAHKRWLLKNFICCGAGRDGHACNGDLVVHHDRRGADGGSGLKPSDAFGVVLCDSLHMEGHNKGWEHVETTYGIDLEATHREAWRISPARIPFEAKLRREGLA